MEYFSISEQYAKAPDNIKKASLNEKWNPNYRGTKYGDSLVLCKLIEKNNQETIVHVKIIRPQPSMIKEQIMLKTD